MAISTIFIIVCLLLGAIQGIIFGIIIIRIGGANVSAGKILATILFLISYSLAVQSLRLMGIGRYDFWYHVFIDVNWIYGPLIFLFVKAHLTPNFKIGFKDWPYFIPVSIQFLASNFVRMQNFYWDGTKASLSPVGYWAYIIWMNHPTVYIIASFLIVFYAYKARRFMLKTNENIEIIPGRILWIKHITRAFSIYFGLFLSIILVDWLFFDLTTETDYYYFIRFYYYPFFIGLAGLTYWLGIVGFLKKDDALFKIKPQISLRAKEQLTQIAEQLKRLMEEEKVYKDPNLNLTVLAGQLDIKPYLLTRCFKYILKKKFTDYLQEKRITEVQALLSNPIYDHYSLLGIAMEAGFNSKSSFNRAVKKYLGISPSTLRKGEENAKK